MPIMDGYETTKILKNMMRNKEIPEMEIWAVSANDEKEDLEKCLSSGMQGHVAKPLTHEKLNKIFRTTQIEF